MPSINLLQDLDAVRRGSDMPAMVTPWESEGVKRVTAAIQERLRHECPELLKGAAPTTRIKEELTIRILTMIQTDASLHLPDLGIQELAHMVYDHVAGLGPLQQLVDRPEVSEIMVNRHDDVWVEENGKMRRCPEVRFRDDLHVFYVAQRVLAPIGIPFSAASPLATGRLPGNLRVSAAMPPAQPCCTLNIRKPALSSITTEDYLARGMANEPMLRILQAAAQGRANILVAGPTGTGKSTLLRYIGQYFPKEARILVLEQIAELGLEQHHPHVISFECPPEREATGGHSMADLLVHALHRRPDYIIVGEVRGPESLQLLMAMATGHPGASTVHAESPERLFNRLALAILQARLQVSNDQLLKYLAEAVDVVAYVERMANGSRRITHLAEIEGFRDDNPVLRPLWDFEPTLVNSEVCEGQFVCRGQMSDRLQRKLGRWGVDLDALSFVE